MTSRVPLGASSAARVVDHLDVPRVQRVLVEPQADQSAEVELHGAHAEREARPLGGVGAEKLVEQGAIGDERVVGLRSRRLRVPCLPHRRREGVGDRLTSQARRVKRSDPITALEPMCDNTSATRHSFG